MFMRRPQTSISQYRGFRRFSPLLLSGMLVPVVLALTVATIFVQPKAQTYAAAADDNAVNCTLIVPPNPLTAQGLATPYQLKATDSEQNRCNEANPLQAAFVQAAVIDPTTGKISIYNPLVINEDSKPAVAPVVPVLPKGAVIGIWFGFNGNALTLEGSENSLQDGNCVNGVGDSIFGQFSYCNAPAFFQAANQAIQAGKLVPPPLGTAKDGMSCPTTRDFSIVDQDQSDNVTTTYLISGSDRVAQDTAANAAALQGLVQKNGSDERLLTAVDNAIGCTPWMAPDLADPGKMVPALPLNELQAAAHQNNPTALVPGGDPMVLKNGETNLEKINAYRVGVDQPAAQSKRDANTKMYCKNLLAIAPQRIFLDADLTKVQLSPDPAVANSLFTFLAQRFVTTYEKNGLNCMKLLDQRDPIKVKTNGDGVAVDARLRSDNGSDHGSDN